MTYNKSSMGLLKTLLLFQQCSAVMLDSTLTPCAEQALVQIESAVQSNHYCLCYQYAEHQTGQAAYSEAGTDTPTAPNPLTPESPKYVNYLTATPGPQFKDDTPTRADGMRIIKALDFGNPMTTFPGVPLVPTASIAGQGALILANNGHCEDRAYVVSDQYDDSKCANAGDTDTATNTNCCAATGAAMLCLNDPAKTTERFIAVADEKLSLACATDVISYKCQRAPPAAAAPPDNFDPMYLAEYGPGIIGSSYAAGGQLVNIHKVVPVTNERCLYAIWMCACWANQADGCLCAQENSGQESVTIEKPSGGRCRDGGSRLTDTTAMGDGVGHAKLGAGGLALRCSPNPCQACCKHSGGSTGGSCGCGGGSGGGSSGCCCGGGIEQNVGCCGGGGGGCGGGGGGGYSGGGGCCCGGGGGSSYGGGSSICGPDRQDCIDTCGRGHPCSCAPFCGCENPFLQCPEAGCCCC